MIETALADAETQGKKGLTGKELMVRSTGGGGRESAGPVSFQMPTGWSQRLRACRKEGNLFIRVAKNKTPSDLLEGVS